MTTMATFDGLVSIARVILRQRNQWHMGATAFADIERAVSDSAEAIRGEEFRDLVTLDMIHAAIAELKRCATPAEV
jgi:hypothetical protein